MVLVPVLFPVLDPAATGRGGLGEPSKARPTCMSSGSRAPTVSSDAGRCTASLLLVGVLPEAARAVVGDAPATGRPRALGLPSSGNQNDSSVAERAPAAPAGPSPGPGGGDAGLWGSACEALSSPDPSPAPGATTTPSAPAAPAAAGGITPSWRPSPVPAPASPVAAAADTAGDEPSPSGTGVPDALPPVTELPPCRDSGQLPRRDRGPPGAAAVDAPALAVPLGGW